MGIYDRLSLYQIFLQVAQTQSFSATARQLNLTQGQVSKAVAKLEEILNVRLFVRSTRQVVLSDEGKNLLGLAREMVDLNESLELTAGQATEPAGHLRISCPTGLGRKKVAPLLPGFQKLFPKVTN